MFECGDSQFSHCDAPIRLTLPDGTVEQLQQSGSPYLCNGRGAALPTDTLNALPALATSWQRRAVGTGVVVADNTAMIAQVLSGGGAGNPPADGGAGGSAGGNSSTDGGTTSQKSASGCDCGVTAPGGPALASLPMVLLALLSLRRRRR